MARVVDLEGAAHLVLTAAVPLHPHEAVFDAMLDAVRRADPAGSNWARYAAGVHRHN